MGQFKNKLYEALNALVGDNDLERRLSIAAGPLTQLQDRDIPEEYRPRFAALKASLPKASLGCDPNYVPAQMSEREARDLSERILRLFFDAMGGL
ncbi:hypothetical protein IYX23_03735 [Methylocystis sp. L43]|uniref:hypothetical protein n=1 Tax=unclassified Methylocystis TaxID=2625913 RepID=UPI0018C31395|nr:MULTISPECIES: hypothetical protein [unclassified Methylocystis]MBG0796808.1 hypothetical protein [Methylocystis sp. L43]MBG0806095.1 hypothetical protein [Methylocystis sp. H15]